MHIAWNHLWHSTQKMASWLFRTLHWHSPQGYLAVFLFFGPGFGWISPDFKCSWDELVAPVLWGTLSRVNVLRRVCLEGSRNDKTSSGNFNLWGGYFNKKKQKQKKHLKGYQLNVIVFRRKCSAIPQEINNDRSLNIFKTDCVSFRFYLYSRMENLITPSWVFRFFNTIPIKVISAQDKGLFFILFYFIFF